MKTLDAPASNVFATAASLTRETVVGTCAASLDRWRKHLTLRCPVFPTAANVLPSALRSKAKSARGYPGEGRDLAAENIPKPQAGPDRPLAGGQRHCVAAWRGSNLKSGAALAH